MTSRLLSPTHRRIHTPTSDTDKARLTQVNLVALGWRRYDGPAIVDHMGFVIPGSDPLVTPDPIDTHA